MLHLLAPVLAQLVTLNVGDRTGVRYLGGVDERSEGITRPTVGLNFDWSHASLTLSYSPSFTVTPLEKEPRELWIFQSAAIGATYRWRRTSIYVSEGLGYGDLSFRAQAIADPGAPAPPVAPGTPTQTPVAGPTIQPGSPGAPVGNPTPGTIQAVNQVRVQDGVIHYGSATTTAGIAHRPSRSVTVGADAGYVWARGLGPSREDYPPVSGERVNAYINHLLIISRRDEFTSSATAQLGTSSLGNQVVGIWLNEGWTHKLNGHTTTRVGAGVGANRLSQDDGLVAISIYPTVNAGINRFDKLAGGALTLGATVNASPYLDPLRATIDPRLGVGISAGWGKDRFAIGMGAGAAISLADNNDQGAVNSVGGSIGSAYFLGRGFSLDGGVTAGWQTFQGETIIPASWSAYIGISWAASVPLNGTARH